MAARNLGGFRLAYPTSGLDEIDIVGAPRLGKHDVMRSHAQAAPNTAKQVNSLTAIERAGLAPASILPASVASVPSRVNQPAPRLLLLLHGKLGGGIEDALMRGAAEAASVKGYAFASMDIAVGHDGDALAEFITTCRPAGIILAPSFPEDRQDIIDLIAEQGGRCLRIGRKGDIDPMERAAAAAAVHWLVSMGHARIGFVAGPDASCSARERELGYLDAMAEHGLDRGPALIVQGDDTFDAGADAARVLLEISPRPTAILAASDEMAAGALHAAAQAGIAVPQDLGVVGFDDTALARMTLPPLTSLHIPWGAAAACAALSIIDGRPVHLPPEATVDITERASIAARV